MCAKYGCGRCRKYFITPDSLIPRDVISLPPPFNIQKAAQWTGQQITSSCALLGAAVGLLGVAERTWFTSIHDRYLVSSCPPFLASDWLVRPAFHRSSTDAGTADEASNRTRTLLACCNDYAALHL